MRVLLINPPHPAIGSRIPSEHLPPLGLLALGGPLVDAGHDVELLDADLSWLSCSAIVERVSIYRPDVVLVGHSGSTSGHPGAMAITRTIRRAHPRIRCVYGGVFPTFHSERILDEEPQIDVIVRGEGEAVIVELIRALQSRRTLALVQGITFRDEQGKIRRNALPSLISPLDDYRIGWELIDHRKYRYWGKRRAVVAQFSRGCPHHCTYCGQRPFWGTWRHRDPKRFAAELAELHRRYGVEVINLADENPTASRSAWKEFLEALIAENTGLILVGSTRADDIVRDADLLPLYRRAGVQRFLLGMESTDERTLLKLRKGSQTATDQEAIRLLRQNGIISMVAFVADFEESDDADCWRTLRQLLAYDPDQIQALYATPHAWTGYAKMSKARRVIQEDLSKWDYKHQVLENEHMAPWRMLLWIKFIEAVAQLRPRSLWRLLAHPNAEFRRAMRWYYSIGRQVWPYELWQFIFGERRTRKGSRLEDFWNRWRSIRAHQVQERAADAQSEQVVDDVEDDELPDLAPNLGFVRGADVKQK